MGVGSVQDDDFGASLREALGHDLTDTLATAGNHSDLTDQTK
jgi:hypothetical protein